MKLLSASVVMVLLAQSRIAFAAISAARHGNAESHRLARALSAPPGKHYHQGDAAKLDPRQSSPPITTVPKCDDYDGYFYVTPRNYTWQLQCATNYEGDILAQADAANFSSCIGSCVDYNRANSPGACSAITFNGPSDGATGLCTQYSEVSGTLFADEEGNVQDSALLILGPDGQIFATPQPDPYFSGAPTQAPSIDPLVTTTTSTTTGIITTSPLLTSIPSSFSSTVPTIVTTTTITSSLFITSCAPEAEGCLPPSSPSSTTSTGPATTAATTSTSISMTTGTSNSQSGSTSSASGSDGGLQPTSPMPTQSTTASTAFTVDAVQMTYTTIVPFTEYRVQMVELCAATPTPCSQSSITSTIIGLRTQISCSPGACSGLMLATGTVSDLAATDVCIVP